MSPVQIIEGSRKLDPVSERNLAERRFSALAAAVREHEATVRRREFSDRARRTRPLPPAAPDLRRRLATSRWRERETAQRP